MVFAFVALRMNKTKQRYLSSRHFETIRKYNASVASLRMKGKPSLRKGKSLTIEQKQKMSRTRKQSQKCRDSSIANAKKATAAIMGKKDLNIQN